MKLNNGSISVCETEFQELFELYWNAADGSREREFVISEINKYIYRYITRKNPSDFDLASDFFVQVMPRTKNLIEEYDISYHISFLAYLTSKIKRRFINYKLKTLRKRTMENLNEFYEINPEAENKSVFDTSADYLGTYGFWFQNKLSSYLSTLNREEEISIKLYYCFLLGYRELRYLKQKFGNTQFLKHYRGYLAHRERKLAREKILRGNISKKLYTASILLQENYQPNVMKRRSRLIAEFYAIKNPVPLRFIADILQTNVTNIHRKIKRGRKKLLEDFQGQMEIPILEESRQRSEKKRAA